MANQPNTLFEPVHLHTLVLNVTATQRLTLFAVLVLTVRSDLGHLNIRTMWLRKSRQHIFWSSKWWWRQSNWIFIDGRIKIIALNLWWWPRNSERLILILEWNTLEQSGWRLSPSLCSQCVTAQREEMGWKARDVVLYMNGLISAI